MSILNNDILTKEYTEKNVPISMPLLYNMGWRFAFIPNPKKPNDGFSQYPNPIEISQTSFELPDCYNQFWMVNVHYDQCLQSEVKIGIRYKLDGCVCVNGPGYPNSINTTKIANYTYDNMPIRSLYDLQLLDKYLKVSQERIDVNVELQKIQHQYQWEDEHISH